MSTAEQIIAEVVREHTPMHDNGPFGDDPWTGCAGKDCADWPGGDDEAFDAHVAAHVVAALTNAGKTIVELPEADETVPETEDENSRVIWNADGGHVTVFGDGALEMGIPYRFNVEADEARAVAAALLAAARVAEGGDQP
ncbi:hypothetical protein LRM64_19630 [Prescottella equi]|uniref:hypothetical protein n=1 Tax=Rhodococcus hoagii TaxID=43767 RepID=UPI0019F43A52|nr:hypothetical protein [Prescottella equi]MBM4580904.1 hypothetical protein [Prescottella equi]MBM4580966.1 hypothetical protein [Prescottella equi]MBM4581415.1 hypothetical protein [Prescottella equi]MBM4707086.1 hypothetical protein [Prescottella equi]MCU7527427.1 hypothetical protein [Prescottella equi]